MHRTLRFVASSALLVALFGPSCAELPDLEAGVCGNAIVEPEREDCDGFATEPGSHCRPASEPDGCRFDCLQGADGAAHVCPHGWGCGTDGICRRGAAHFARLGERIEEDALELGVADFDADGRDDVLVSSPSEQRIHYFDAGGTLAKTVTMASTPTRPAIGALTLGDDWADLALNVGFGLGVLRGRDDRTVVPTQYPFFPPPEGASAHLFAVDDDDTFGDAVYLFSNINLLGVVDGSCCTIRRVTKGAGASDVFVVEQGADALAGPIPRGRLQPDAACESFVVGFRGDSRFTVYTPCAQSPLDEITVSLSEGAKLHRGLFLVDANGDGYLDVVGGSSEPCVVGGDCCGTETAFGSPTGFTSDPTLATIDGHALDGYLTATGGTCAEGVDAPESPLAMGDLNGDGIADLVDAEWISFGYLGEDNGKPYYFRSVGHNTAPWSEAVIADLNDDGFADVLGGSKVISGIDFLHGTGMGVFNPLSIATQLPTAHFSLGDFDGDGVADLAFSELSDADASAPPNTSGDSLSVLFGRPSAPPEDPVRMGKLDDVLQIVSGHSVEYPLAFDAVSDLAVVSQRGGATTPTVLLFAGSTGRQLQSPHFLSRAPLDIIEYPALLATGRFDEGAQDDLAVIAREYGASSSDGDYRLWWVDVSGEAELTSSEARSADLPGAYLTAETLGVGATLGAVDLDDDGVDELVSFVPALLPGPAYEARLLIARAKRGADWVWSVDDAAPFPEHFVAIRTQIGDVDGDGRRDVAVLFYEPDTSIALTVFWNDGSGALDPSRSTTVTAPVDPADPTRSDEPIAFALLDVDDDTALEVALISTAHAYLVEVEPATRALGPATLLDSLPGGTSIAAGDIDGDGVDDVVIASAGAVEVRRGVPVLD
jgi:hypothetical protein